MRICLGAIKIVKNTHFLMEGDWFLCEDDRYLGLALTKHPAGIILTRETYLKNKAPALSAIPKLFITNPYEEWTKFCAMSFTNRPSFIVGITGTNGKTTVAYTTYKLWNSLGLKAGYIGTYGIYPVINSQSKLTTPDAFHLHQVLHEFKNMGIDHVAIEISSSALQRKRVSQLRLNTGVFTSFSQDHLDIHKTMDNYLNTKLELAELVDEHYLVSKQVEEYVQNRWQNYEIYDQTINYKHPNFIGFMESNLQAACKVCELSGFSRSEIKSALQNELCVPGRLEVVSQNPKVIIDYAHTPDGLVKVLDLFKNEKVILVFGCGGDRDKSKREVMGRIAKAGAAIAVVTDDNPRTESPEEIRKAIMTGCPSAIEISDRELAIKYAVETAKSTGYICLICGKGHENTQIYAERTEYFSDRECALKYSII